MAKKPRLTADERKVLAAIVNGADVWSYQTAMTIRKIEREHPELVDVGPPAGRYSGVGPVPYLGAIATAAGRRAVGRT